METFFALLALYDRGILLTKPSDEELGRFLWDAPEQTIEQTIETSVIGAAIALIFMSL